MVDTGGINNQLLARLSAFDRTLVSESSSNVILDKGIDLGLPGTPIRSCWFPTSGMVSVIAMDENGGEAEVGLIGREGAVNAAILLGETFNTMRLLVQIGGTALKIDADVLLNFTAESPTFAANMRLYQHALSIQVASSALAFARYTITQRLARWLLMCGDRVGDANLPLTHEALAIMLGVRRSGVTVAIGGLGHAVQGSRGSLSIIDRPALLRIAGPGYGAPK